MKKKWILLLLLLLMIGGRIAWVNFHRVPVRTYRTGDVIQIENSTFSIKRFYRASPKEQVHFMELEKEVWKEKFEEMSSLYNKPTATLYIMEVESKPSIDLKYFEAVYKKGISYQIISAYRIPAESMGNDQYRIYFPLDNVKLMRMPSNTYVLDLTRFMKDHKEAYTQVEFPLIKE